ncbi:MAG: prepilin-type N-terminal cleavage/methylation domain-containing protein [Verrucomicrobia bacterium]|nr:prepilin-type N-terminal cleavage/methylation domain-containing protein [Verrucomicrobiota bacterium]MCH8525781.1 prepilin-type N-terminal cleavage/methylation domain-containing protein [Kiritimatiellia bacterium]
MISIRPFNTSCPEPSRTQNGFTLIEMLVVIAIIALISAIMMPAVNRGIQSSQHAASMSNLRQWGVANISYLVDSRGRMPSRGPDQQPNWAQAAQDPGAWYNVLPPYVDETPIMEVPAAERVRFLQGRSMHRDPAANFNTEALTGRPLFSYTFNSQLNVSRTHGNVIPGRGDLRGEQLFIDSYRTPSNTVLFFESRVRREDGHSSETANSQMARAYGHSRHISFRYGGRVNLLFLDGGVRRFKSNDLFNGQNVVNDVVIWEGLE